MNGLHSGHMSTPQIAEHRVWGWRGSVGAIAVAAVIAAVGGAAIYAATEGTSHPFGASHQPGPQVGMHGAMGAPGQSDSAPQSLHGESVVADGNGGYRTELTQTGTVTAVSPTSITVRSADGYTQSYVIPAAARRNPVRASRFFSWAGPYPACPREKVSNSLEASSISFWLSES